MDDLKLYGRNPDQLKGLLHTVRIFSDDIQMKFGLDKCANTLCLRQALWGEGRKTDTINCLDPSQVYKYLGVDESNSIQHSNMWETLHREYFRRVKMVLRTELYGRNKILAINGFALPVLTYGFGVIHWRTTDLQQLDRRTRKLLSMPGVHHPAADVDRLYASCTKGSQGLRQIESMYQSCIVVLDCYLRNSYDMQWYRSVMLGGPLVRFNAWLISLRTTSRRVYMEVGSSCLVVSLSKHLRQM